MRVCEIPFSLTSLVLTALISRPVVAGLLPDFLQSFEDLQDVRKRCSNPCGYYGQLCCESNELCYTDTNDQAQCGPATAGVAATTAAGQWEYFTTTFLQTDLKTVTLTSSTFIPAATPSCSYSLGETPCGNVCCLSGQFCQASGICALVGGGSSGFYSSLYTVTTIITNTASAPIRPTSNTVVTVPGGATVTQPFVTPVSSDGSVIIGHQTNGGGGLSGGAIAGIVIGVIVGIILLLLFCACCLFKGLIDGLLAIFGLGKRRRRTTEEEVYVERHSHRDNRGRRTWFGARPARSEVVEEKRKKSGWGTAGWMAAGLGGLALWLGLKRRNRRDDKSSSGYSGSSYYDYSASSSESSSDRRTRRSSRSRSRR